MGGQQGRRAIKVSWDDGLISTFNAAGPTRQVSPEMLGDTWNHGESLERYPVDAGRLRRVVETAAREAGWGRTLPKGRGLGTAAHYSFVSYIAAVVEVAVDDTGAVTIPRVDMAVDCGATVNPDRVRAQMEGVCVMGVGVATLGETSYSKPMGGVGEPGCCRSRPRCATRSSRRRASGSAASRSAIS